MRNFKVFSLFLFFASILIPQAAQAATDWTPPTPEELSMKAEPNAPGAVAIYLDREETSDNKNNNNSDILYNRVKILTEAGKEYGNIAILYPDRVASIDDFEGRTIHSDGTIIPFQGKGMDQTETKSGGQRIRKKIFAMPDVQVGSILEFRYRLDYTDGAVVAPNWYIQSELYVRKAHYLFIPFSSGGGRFVTDSNGQRLDTIAYTSVLPSGVAPQKMGELRKGTNGSEMQDNWVLDVTNIPPIPKAAHLPPIRSLSYKVQFFYTAYRSTDEFWKKGGKVWSKEVDQFANPGPQVKDAVAKMSAGSEDQKLRSIYAAVMQLKNTRYIHSGDVAATDQKAPAKNSDDIWTRKRGNPKQITRLFVAMARAAGMKAYVMDVTNRNHNVFSRDYLSFDQMNGEIAIVQVDDKEQFFDPGSLYCPYGQLAWTHTLTAGLRQVDYGTALAQTTSTSYKDNATQRSAVLALAPDGSVSGLARLVYLGQPALSLRQREADTDIDGVTKKFEDLLKNMLPAGMTVHLTNISSLQDGEKPLTLDYVVHGPAALVASRHVLFPSQLFEVNHKQIFVSDTRKYPVYFHYPYQVIDQVSVTLPVGFSAENLPKDQSADDPNVAAYRASVEQAGQKLTFHRVFALANIYIAPKDYSQLHSFFSQVSSDDQTPAMLASSK